MTAANLTVCVPDWACTGLFLLLLAERELKHLPLNFGCAFERVLRVLSVARCWRFDTVAVEQQIDATWVWITVRVLTVAIGYSKANSPFYSI